MVHVTHGPEQCNGEASTVSPPVDARVESAPTFNRITGNATPSSETGDGSQNRNPVGSPRPRTDRFMVPEHRGLLPHHLDDLRRSGLNDETIRAAGIYSETNRSHLAEILNWRSVPATMSSALVFPFRRADGQSSYSRTKPDQPRHQDGKPVKYESPRGRSNEVYIPPHTFVALSDPTVPILITEGEKKSLAADQHGMPCLGLVGVHGWKDGRSERLLPDLERVAWRGRGVRIVYDSDLAQNDNVRAAEIRLAAHLTSRGAQVRVVRLPSGPADNDGAPTKVGLDDYLVLHGLGAFQRLLDAAESPAEPDALIMKKRAKDLDPCSQIEAFLELKKIHGVSTLRSWRGSWYSWAGGHYTEISKDFVQSELVKHLNQLSTHLTVSVTNNHAAQLKALTILSDHIEAPAWIGGGPEPWPAHEVLASRNSLIHLPSLVDNEDYLRSATPCFFSTVALDYDFVAAAPRPDVWFCFLERLWPNDPQSIATLQEWFGYCLTQDTRRQKILFILGPPRSGKGTLCRILRQLIGPDNVAGPTLASLGTNFGLWPLLNKSLATITDARLSGRSDSAVVIERLLSISGEDALTVDRKNLTPVTAKLNTRLMILTNELPKFSDASGALAQRMVLLQLTQSWLGREDHCLLERLEAELPGILLWAIWGWQRLREQGRFTVPSSAANLHTELEDLISPVGAFVRVRCVTGPLHEVSRQALYNAYCAWSREVGRTHVEDQAGFGRNLRAVVPALGDAGHRTGEGRRPERYYTGIALSPTASQGS